MTKKQLQDLVEEARREIARKSIDEIQKETAWKWAARAAAAAETGRHQDAHEYAHEAVEHAGLSEDDDLIGHVRAFLRSHGASPN
jgi:hypothetical protein